VWVIIIFYHVQLFSQKHYGYGLRIISGVFWHEYDLVNCLKKVRTWVTVWRDYSHIGVVRHWKIVKPAAGDLNQRYQKTMIYSINQIRHIKNHLKFQIRQVCLLIPQWLHLSSAVVRYSFLIWSFLNWVAVLSGSLLRCCWILELISHWFVSLGWKFGLRDLEWSHFVCWLLLRDLGFCLSLSSLWIPLLWAYLLVSESGPEIWLVFILCVINSPWCSIQVIVVSYPTTFSFPQIYSSNTRILEFFTWSHPPSHSFIQLILWQFVLELLFCNFIAQEHFLGFLVSSHTLSFAADFINRVSDRLISFFAILRWFVPSPSFHSHYFSLIFRCPYKWSLVFWTWTQCFSWALQSQTWAFCSPFFIFQLQCQVCCINFPASKPYHSRSWSQCFSSYYLLFCEPPF